MTRNRPLALLHRRSVAALRLIANLLVSPLEAIVTSGRRASTQSIAGPVFIVGPPRSGTTLLFQLVTAAFDIGYLTNRHCRWYRAPVFVERLSPTPFAATSDFRSELGVTSGPHSPCECGHFWYRFLPRRPHSLGDGDVTDAQLARLGRSVSALAGAFGKSLVFKNLITSLRIGVLIRAFPNAIFLVSRRDVSDTAVSILHARQRLHGNLGRWFSVRPSSCERFNENDDPFAQVAAQVLATYDEISKAREANDGRRFLDVPYERLCQQPVRELSRIAQFTAQLGLPLHLKPEFSCPDRFSPSSAATESPRDWRERLDTAIGHWKAM